VRMPSCNPSIHELGLPSRSGLPHALPRHTVWFVLMIAYGIALDPKSQAVFGPLLAPIMLGCLIFVVFTSAGGLASQPNLAFTLCLAPAIVMDGPYDRAIWISFVGPVISCALHAISFIIVPPHHAEDGVRSHASMTEACASNPPHEHTTSLSLGMGPMLTY